MLVLSSINIKAALIRLESYTISHFWAKHHLAAVHEVEHYVFQFGLKRFFINEIEINLIIRGNLDSNISFDVVDKTSNVNVVVLNPFLHNSFFFFKNFLVYFLFKKQNFTGTPGNQCWVIHQVHLTEVHFCHSFKGVIFRVFCVNLKGVALAIERIDFIFVWIIKAPIRKILFSAVNLSINNFSNNSAFLEVIDEMVV